VAESQDFSKAWEHFCCKLLNIKNKTTTIYVRNPPEQGIDLYYPSKKIAYQCKSVESGKSGDFNVTHAIQSIQTALSVKKELGWKKYVLCVNVDISGTAEKALKEALPEIEILSTSNWVRLCEKHPIEVEINFRRILEVPRAKVLDAINDTFIEHYSRKLKKKIENSHFDIFIYCNTHDKTYRIAVSEEFSCGDLHDILCGFFKLPKPAKIEAEEINVALSHHVIFNGAKLTQNQILKDLGVTQGSIITFWTTILWRDAEKTLRRDVIHMMTSSMASWSHRTLAQRRDSAIAKYSSYIKKCFEEFDGKLLNNTEQPLMVSDTK
jgi:hypothetical protein